MYRIRQHNRLTFIWIYKRIQTLNFSAYISIYIPYRPKYAYIIVWQEQKVRALYVALQIPFIYRMILYCHTDEIYRYYTALRSLYYNNNIYTQHFDFI